MSVTTATVKLAQNAVAPSPPSRCMARRQLSSLQTTGAEPEMLAEVIADGEAKMRVVAERIGLGRMLMDVKGES